MINQKFKLNHQIPSTIIDLIKSSKQYCFIVTPYYQPWKQLIKSLELASIENKKIIFAFREDQQNNSDIIQLNREFNFDVFFINNLHAKIYLNESEALISSMNLYDHSKENNFEIAYTINSKSEISDIVKIVILGELFTTWVANVLPGKYYNQITENDIFNAQKTTKAPNSLAQKNISNALDSFCIRCKDLVKYDFNRPLCNKCFNDWNIYQNKDYEENYCLKCGKGYGTSFNRPLCIDCFKNSKNVFVR